MKWFSNLDRWLQIVIVIVIIIILYMVYRWIKLKMESSNYNKAVNQSQGALNDLAQQGINPSYPLATYTSLGNTIQQAMEGCGAGFDETLKPAFEQIKNDADIYALIKAYDVRTIDKCGLLTGDFTGDLSATLAYKFSGVEDYFVDGSISKINNILASNNIKFRF